MSSVNYSLKHKGVRLIASDEAWVKGKNGKRRFNPKYHFVGKIDTKLPNMIVTASDKKKKIIIPSQLRGIPFPNYRLSIIFSS